MLQQIIKKLSGFFFISVFILPFILLISFTQVINGQTKSIPYPIIFVHGLDGGQNTFGDEDRIVSYLQATLNLSNPRTFHVCLNHDDDHQTAVLLEDVMPVAWTNLHSTQPITPTANDRLFILNLREEEFQDINNHGEHDRSNESAIYKQGYALKLVINQVLNITDCDKVILVGHSMGGLAIREYLQRTEDENRAWWVDSSDLQGGHKVAKVVTIGTPHLGSNSYFDPTSLDSSIPPDINGEAMRDLKYSYDAYPGCPLLDPQGIYLFGGSEFCLSEPFSFDPFDNLDINCNGSEDDFIIGLNSGTSYNPTMNLPTTVEYTWIISDVGLGENWGLPFPGTPGDGAVLLERQWLYDSDFNPMPLGVTEMFMTNTIHVGEGGDNYALVRGLDESDNSNFAYPINPNVATMGFITVQAPNTTIDDVDYYRIDNLLPGTIKIILNGVGSGVNQIEILDANFFYLNGASVGYVPFQLDAVVYTSTIYIKIIGQPNVSTWNNPYQLEVQFKPDVDVAFIIDDTGSMSEEIAGVRQALLAHLATYDPNSGTVFQLTTFKDNFTVREPTTDLALIQSQVAALFASGGGDCPEASVEAINAVIDGIKDNGRAFLATDASPHAGLDIEGSIAALRAKGIRVDVVLSGDCYSYSSSPLASGQSVNQGGTGNVPTEVLKYTDQQTPPPTEAIFTAIEAFSLMAQETGGIFAFIPEVNFGSASAVQRFQNTIFNITQGGITQSLAYIQPYTGPAGGSVRITIVGASTNFRSNTALAFEGDGVTVGNITVISPSRLEATVTIDPTAALGFRNLTATTNLGGGIIETATGVGAFEIVNSPVTPTIIGINPPLAELGQTLNVTVNGINTNFTNSSVLNLGSGVAVNSVSAVSSTQLTAEISVSAVTTVGFRSVTVITGGEVATENVTGPFFVAPVTTPLPELISVSPASGAPGTNLNLTISGANTVFVNNISSVGFSGSGIDVLGVNVISPTLLTASIHIADDAEPGYRDVRVTTDLEVAVLLDGFLVTEDVTPTYPYLFLSNTDVEISRVLLSEGAIHANDDIKFLTGYPGNHYGNLTAVDDITIRVENFITGDVTAGDEVDNYGVVNGVITEDGAVDPVTLPDLAPFSAGEMDVEVAEGATLALDPGAYAEVEVKRSATLQLRAGEYFMDRLETLLGSKIEINVDDGPVTVNVVTKLYFGPEMEVSITSGETASSQVTFNSLQTRDLEIRRGARVLGSIIAPYGGVEFLSYAQYRGTVIADDISVNQEATLLHHNSSYTLPERVLSGNEVAAYQNAALPTRYELLQNYPNPFNPETVIRYALPEKAEVTLRIYNVNGQLVKSLVRGSVDAGYHQATWNGTNDAGEKVASGIYFYRLQAGSFQQVRKMFFLK